MDNMEKLLTPDFWIKGTQFIWEWFYNRVLSLHTILDIIVIVGCFFLGWLVYRYVKPLYAGIRGHRFLQRYPLNLLYDDIGHVLYYIFTLIFMWISHTAIKEAGITLPLTNTVLSLSFAWIIIRIISAFVKEKNWSRFLAFLAWSIAALHIVSLLDPVIRLLDGISFQMGDVHISILLCVKAAIVLALLFKLAVIAHLRVEKKIMTLEGLTPSVQVLLSKAIKVGFIFTALLVSLSSLGINLSAFAFFGGAVGVGIGFGLQKVISNLISGVILLADRSIKPGDVIALEDTYGRIQSLSARYVSVVTRDGAEYLIPNEDLITRQVVNWSFSNKLVRLKIGVGVSYDSDIHQVMGIMRAAAERSPRVLKVPAPVCQLKNFGDNSIDMELRIWISDPENGISNVMSDIRVAIWDDFRKNGIEIPFPQRDIHIKES